jgi:hypothetical protein
MISLEAVIRHFGQEALRLQLAESEKGDSKTLLALENRAAPDRSEVIRSWLQSYAVFQGIDGPNRPAIATALLEWGDSRNLQRDLRTVNALVAAHEELMTVCTRANGKKRDFTSLASKALWLCYPNSTPIFDRFAQRTLWVISKLEPDITVLPDTEPEYRKFVHVWKALYDRYTSAINEIDLGTYPYRVRIFDKILWLIGEPRYGVRPNLAK